MYSFVREVSSPLGRLRSTNYFIYTRLPSSCCGLFDRNAIRQSQLLAARRRGISKIILVSLSPSLDDTVHYYHGHHPYLLLKQKNHQIRYLQKNRHQQNHLQFNNNNNNNIITFRPRGFSSMASSSSSSNQEFLEDDDDEKTTTIGWEVSPSSNNNTLLKTFYFEDDDSALSFQQQIDDMMNSNLMSKMMGCMKNLVPSTSNMIKYASTTTSPRDDDDDGKKSVDLTIEISFLDHHQETEEGEEEVLSRNKSTTQMMIMCTKMIDTMWSINQIKMSDYTYNLDYKSIAKYPANPRGSSKLLYVDVNNNNNGGNNATTTTTAQHYPNFSNSFPSIIGASDKDPKKGSSYHIVFNNSKVVNARLYVTTPSPSQQQQQQSSSSSSSSSCELMILDLGNIDMTCPCYKVTNLRAMIRLPHVEEGQCFVDTISNTQIKITKVHGIWHEDDKSDGNGIECWIQIDSQLTVDEFLNEAGSVPIPPYFHREAEDSDKIDYNNVYAATNDDNNDDGTTKTNRKSGSVAAPTAGLHFTPDILNQIGHENISYLSLHVGAGTFKPVLTDDANKHSMHAESFSVQVHELKQIIAALEDDDDDGNNKSLYVVGTTSCRTLESLYWCGVKRLLGIDIYDDAKSLNLEQFEWVPLSALALAAASSSTVEKVEKNFDDTNNSSQYDVDVATALQSLIEDLSDDDYICGRTSLMITPGSYKFKVVKNLITNFHAPDSTLILLVSAFCNNIGQQQQQQQQQLSDDRSGSSNDNNAEATTTNAKTIQTIYEEAQDLGYRFLSYGDVCLFANNSPKKQ